MFAMGKVALGMAAVALTAGVVTGAGTASAEPGPDGRYYGSIALGQWDDGTETWGTAYNYPNWQESDWDAVSECGYAHCTVEVRFVDGCGAIAKSSGSNPSYFRGTGATRFDAERAALQAAYRPSSMSASGGPGILVVSQCTDNVR